VKIDSQTNWLPPGGGNWQRRPTGTPASPNGIGTRAFLTSYTGTGEPYTSIRRSPVGSIDFDSKRGICHQRTGSIKLDVSAGQARN